MSPVAPPAPHEKRPPFFQPEAVEIPQSVFNSSHGLLPRIERKLTESAAQPPGKMCECDSATKGEGLTAITATAFPVPTSPVRARRHRTHRIAFAQERAGPRHHDIAF